MCNTRDDDRLRLIRSIENGDAETAIRIFTEQKFDKKFLKPVGVFYVTAVQLAAWQGEIELLDLLYEKGADVNATDKIGRCALFHAAHRGNHEAVNWLLEHGAYTENRVGIEACYKKIPGSASSPLNIGRNVSLFFCK